MLTCSNGKSGGPGACFLWCDWMGVRGRMGTETGRGDATKGRRAWVGVFGARCGCGEESFSDAAGTRPRTLGVGVRIRYEVPPFAVVPQLAYYIPTGNLSRLKLERVLLFQRLFRFVRPQDYENPQARACPRRAKDGTHLLPGVKGTLRCVSSPPGSWTSASWCLGPPTRTPPPRCATWPPCWRSWTGAGTRSRCCGGACVWVYGRWRGCTLGRVLVVAGDRGHGCAEVGLHVACMRTSWCRDAKCHPGGS